MIVDIALAAENDLEDGYWFYKRQHPGLDSYFRINLAGDIQSLSITGRIHKIEHGFYRAISKRFPFGIYNSICQKRVIVAAILDLRSEHLWVRSQPKAR